MHKLRWKQRQATAQMARTDSPKWKKHRRLTSTMLQVKSKSKSSSNSTSALACIHSRNPKLLCELGRCMTPTACTDL